MFCLTHQERKVILFIGILIVAGSLIRFFNIGGLKNSNLHVSERAVASEDNRVIAGSININSATAQELTRISGIGDVLAGRIVEYRLKFGPFRDVEDLKNVKGVGDKKAGTIKKCITF